MHPDGSLMLNSKGELIPTYDQDAIIGFAHVFTGWDYVYTGALSAPRSAPAANWIDPMREVPARHFTGQKRMLNNVVLPGLADGRRPAARSVCHATPAAQYQRSGLPGAAGAGTRRRARPALQPSELRAVHLPPVDPAPGHQHAEPRLSLSRRAEVQRQRQRRARRHEGGHQSDPARLRGALARRC